MFLFIGAGVSTYFDVPDMKGFIDLFDNMFGGKHLYCDIRAFMGEVPNLEVLMTILSDLAKPPEQFWKTIAPHTSSFMMKGNGHATKYLGKKKTVTEARKLINQAQETIFRVCIGQIDTNLDKVQSLYDELFLTIMNLNFHKSPQPAGDGKIYFPSVTYMITTNYDLAIERFWELHQTELNDGLTHQPIEKTYKLAADEKLFKSDKVPALFKFHGSVNLFRKGVDIYRERVSSTDVDKIGIQGIINKYGELTLVYPVESTGREYVTQSPYLDIYAIFLKRLHEQTLNKNLWLILGSSLQDTTLCSAMEYCLSINTAGSWPYIILLSKQASHIKGSLPDRFKRLKQHITPLDAEIKSGDEGFGKLKTLF